MDGQIPNNEYRIANHDVNQTVKTTKLGAKEIDEYSGKLPSLVTI